MFGLPFIEHLRHMCDVTKNDSTFVSFKKNKYNAGLKDPEVQKLLSHPDFVSLITGVMGRSMMFTDGIVFELDPSRTGFDWHIGITSFKYIYPENEAVSIWIPLDPVDRSKQDGGMSFISKSIFNGREFYKLQHTVTESIARKKYCIERPYASMAGHNRYEGEEAKCIEKLRAAARDLSPTTYSDSLYFSSFSRALLEQERESFDFELGDAVLFTKDVFHRSNGLRPGPMPSRRAFVLRFVDIDSRYNEVNDRIMGSESSEIISDIKVAHQSKFDSSKAICLLRENVR
ncbi:MAG: phytanoyl-CoA dioxygenase family protein [Gammaproteobacteria bacterium]|nr:phytanoyl-CoA dioxygenase family protein [Gammaproteobacteria bacterium]